MKIIIIKKNPEWVYSLHALETPCKIFFVIVSSTKRMSVNYNHMRYSFVLLFCLGFTVPLLFICTFWFLVSTKFQHLPWAKCILAAHSTVHIHSMFMYIIMWHTNELILIITFHMHSQLSCMHTFCTPSTAIKNVCASVFGVGQFYDSRLETIYLIPNKSIHKYVWA